MNMNSLVEKFKERKNMGVDKKGTVTPSDPHSDGSQPSPTGATTLQPKRFF